MERHGIMLTLEIFRKAELPVYGADYPCTQFDLRLKQGSRAVDAGVRLPNLNDHCAGKAPDPGCYELGKPVPHYGSRPN